MTVIKNNTRHWGTQTVPFLVEEVDLSPMSKPQRNLPSSLGTLDHEGTSPCQSPDYEWPLLRLSSSKSQTR